MAGLHVLANLQYLTPHENRKKGNRLDATDADLAEYVRRGVAVWTRDVGDDGKVDWSSCAPPAGQQRPRTAVSAAPGMETPDDEDASLRADRAAVRS